MVSPKVTTITPNKNYNIPKVIFVSFGVLLCLSFRLTLKSVDDDARVNKNKGLRFYPPVTPLKC